MARWEFKLPDIGEGVGEGEIVAWLVRPGDAVGEDQPLVEVMTDKATVTITAPRAGRISETRGKVGDTIPVHAVLVVFDVEPAAPAAAPAIETRANGKTHVAPAAELPAANGGRSPHPAPGTEPSAADGYFDAKPRATPATRKVARERDVDLRRVPPTGREGRVTRRDVESFADSGVSPQGAVLDGRLPPLEESAPASDPPAPLLARDDTGAKRIPMAGLRRRIAQKMSMSKSRAAHFTFVEECDVTELKALRSRLKAGVEADGQKLTFLPFVVKAVVAALKKHPMLNATLDETTNEIVIHPHFHIGIATATDAGLVVPVVRDADKKGILRIAQEIDRLAVAARAGKASLDDLHGSTFTITSLGARSGLFATPIINYPEVGILGVHRIKSKPVVRQGQIVIGDVMLVSLSFDHRIVDGDVGAAFAYEVIGYLEQPERLFLEMV